MDGKAHRQGEFWGKDQLSDKVYAQLRIDGVNLKSIPLVDGLQRYARLEPIFAEQTLASYVPQAYR